jgi:hypothetical protein
VTHNVLRGLRRENERLKNVAHGCICDGRPVPVDYRARKTLVVSRIDDKERGDMNRVLGGPEETQKVNRLVMGLVRILVGNNG